MTITKSILPVRGLLSVYLPIGVAPPGRGWRLYSGNSTSNSWIKLPPKPSKRARAAFLKIPA